MNDYGKPTHLDLFSGIGGFALAARWAGFETIGFCEIDGYCRKVLAKNFGAVSCRDDKELLRVGTGTAQRPGKSEESRNFPALCSDIFDLDGRDFAGVSLITGGFPCQPFSVAGKRGGAADDRAIWPEMFRVISEARPAWIIAENVPGIIPMELDRVLSDLEGIGYTVRAFIIPACAVDARHRRDRVWIIGRRIMGDSEQPGLEGCQPPGHMELQGATQPAGSTGATGAAVADSNGTGLQGRDSAELLERSGQRVIGAGGASIRDSADSGDLCRWEPEPAVGRVAHGIPKRVDRLKGLGNAIVPQVAYEILREIRRLI